MHALPSRLSEFSQIGGNFLAQTYVYVSRQCNGEKTHGFRQWGATDMQLANTHLFTTSLIILMFNVQQGGSYLGMLNIICTLTRWNVTGTNLPNVT